MSNKKEKSSDKYHNQGGIEKSRDYYQANKEMIKEKAKSRYQNLAEEQKELKRQYIRDRYKRLVDQADKIKTISFIYTNIKRGRKF